ncbi:MAG: GTPase [Nanoarchaeota archaeon]
MANFWGIVNKVITDADLLLLVLDSRLIDETRNAELETKIRRAEKPLIYVMTKCDLAEKDSLDKMKTILKPSVFISAKDHLGLTKLRERILIEAKRIGVKERVTVGVLGYPNVGKSSLINAMRGQKSAPSGLLSGVTRGVQKIKAGNRILFLDTPGVIPYQEKDYLKHALTGTIDFTHAKEPDLVVFELMQRYPGRIEAFYKVSVYDDKEEGLEAIALVRKILIKGGEPDIMRMARVILKDWQKGVIP